VAEEQIFSAHGDTYRLSGQKIIGPESSPTIRVTALAMSVKGVMS
jgi:hypothetical protein